MKDKVLVFYLLFGVRKEIKLHSSGTAKVVFAAASDSNRNLIFSFFKKSHHPKEYDRSG